MSKMLYEFTCSNFKSIKNQVKFSMLASTDDRYEECVYKNGKDRFLRVASIYGANGSGKSSFLEALSFVKELVEISFSNQPGDVIQYSTHKLAPDGESIFTMQFETQGQRYAYGFSIQQGNVKDEYLYYFPKNKKTKIFERTQLTVSSGSQYRTVFSLAKKAIKDNRLFLSVAANLSECAEVESAFLFIKEDIVFYTENNNWGLYSFHTYLENEKIYQRSLNFLKKLDTGIVGFKPMIEERPLDLPYLPSEVLNKYSEIELDAVVDYSIFKVGLEEESTGIKKLISIIGPIIDVIDTNKVLIFDEMETGLHETIAREIVKVFLQQKGEHNPQLIFSTHDTSLLDANLFRRDQIWFTELNQMERATQLYSLAELKNVRKIENIKNGYIAGKYGAIPMLQPGFEKVFDY